jgi:hypothetical protein
MNIILLPAQDARVEDLLQPVSQTTKAEALRETARLESPKDVVTTLESQPSLEQLSACLDWLTRNADKNTFSVYLPSPHSAQIVHALANKVLPDFWQVIKDDLSLTGLRKHFLHVLRGVTGLSALAGRLTHLSASFRDPPRSGPGVTASRKPDTTALQDIVEVCEAVLAGNRTLQQIWGNLLNDMPEAVPRRMAWNDLSGLVSSGRLLAVLAEADAFLRTNSRKVWAGSWLADGNSYNTWLADNIILMARSTSATNLSGVLPCAEVIRRALSIGYPRKRLPLLSGCMTSY